MHITSVGSSCRATPRNPWYPRLRQRPRDRLAREFGRVAFSGEMSQQYAGEAGMEEIQGKPGGRAVGQVSVAGCDARLDGGGVGAPVEKRLVVVGLQDKEIAARQRVAHDRRGASEIGREADAGTGFGVYQGDGHRIGGVVDGHERFHAQVLDAEGAPGPILHNLFRSAEQTVARPAGGLREPHRHAMASRQHPASPGVIPVFVREDDGRELTRVRSNQPQAALGLARAEAGVDQHGRPPGADENRVALASAAQHADLHDGPGRSD